MRLRTPYLSEVTLKCLPTLFSSNHPKIIAQAFEEAERRDPEKTKVVLKEPHSNYFDGRRPSSRPPEASVFYVDHVTPVIVFTGFELEPHQSCAGSDAISSQSAQFVRGK